MRTYKWVGNKDAKEGGKVVDDGVTYRPLLQENARRTGMSLKLRTACSPCRPAGDPRVDHQTLILDCAAWISCWGRASECPRKCQNPSHRIRLARVRDRDDGDQILVGAFWGIN